MAEIKDGGPAFPVSDMGTHGGYGMSLRDWFAGQALAGIYGSPHFLDHMGGGKNSGDPGLGAAVTAYAAADAMLAARKKDPTLAEGRS